MHMIALVMLGISFFGIPILLILSIIQFLRGKPISRLLLICLGLIPVYFIGIILGDMTAPSYWERQEQTYAEKRENERIQKRINENIEEMHKDTENYEKEMQKNVAEALRTPEQIRSETKFVDYELIQKKPENYIGTYMKFKGFINEIEVVDGGVKNYYITLDTGSGKLVLVRSLIPVDFEYGDHVTVYGNMNDMISYTDINGNNTTAPSITAEIIE